jgi:3-dehydroquinate synthase
METIHVKHPLGSYPIFLGERLLADVGKFLQEMGFSGLCAVVTNPTVGQYYAHTTLDSLTVHGFQPILCEISDGEEYKTLDTVNLLYDEFLAAGLERKSPILALGGGVVGDTAGFAAATYLRGVPLVQIPTSLLAMVDASVGGKTGVDLPQGKNLVGAFKQPEMVLVDSAVLTTLPNVEFRCGLAEVVKHGIIANPTLFSALEENDFSILWMLAEAIRVKVEMVQEDPFEEGRRAVLNLGHTFGHAFERLSDYQIRHGKGVAMGLACATRLAANLGHCSPDTADRIIETLKRLKLPFRPPHYAPNVVWRTMWTDKKKKSGRLRFILPRDIGDVDIFEDVTEDDVKAVLS